MKKALLPFLLVTCLTGSSQISVGLSGGYGAARFSESSFNSFSPAAAAALGASYHTSFTLSYFGGVVIKKEINRKSSLLSGVYFYLKGSRIKMSDPGSMDTTSEFMHLACIQLPVNYLFKMHRGKYLFFVGPGIYISYTYSGTVSGHGTYSGGGPGTPGYFISENIIFRNKDDNLEPPAVIRPIDFGINILAGISCGMFNITVHYSYGLTNIYPYDNPYGFNSKNEGIYISLAGFFKM